ncbi:MAG: rhomboid family intramembrane serine protease [Burkholderiaceae bacterium]
MTTSFFDRLHAATPRIGVTYVIIVINVVVYLATWLNGADPFTPSPSQMLTAGGNFLPYTSEQPWRLMSSTVVHAGLFHLAVNMWVLLQMGKIAERFYGSVQFAVIYLLSGLFGSLCSLFFTAESAVSVGASGAVYGIAGAIIAAVLTKSGQLPPAVVRHLRLPFVAFVVISFGLGLITDWIDNSSHLGGLVAGFMLAALMVARFDWDNFRTRGMQRAMLALFCAATGGATLWKLVPVPSP